MSRPASGAGEARVIVPVVVCPASSVVFPSERPEIPTVNGLSVTAAVSVTPSRVAVRFTEVWTDTIAVVIGTVTVAEPAGTVTVIGRDEAIADSLSASTATFTPPVTALADRVTFA